MAGDSTKIVVAVAGTVSIGAWVTAKGAGSLTDVGYKKGGVRFGPSVEHYKVEPDEVNTATRAIPTKREYELKVPMMQAEMEKARVALGQPAAALTGTPPDYTLVVDSNAGEEYFQIKVVTTGTGTTGVRTITYWRCILKSVAEIPFVKDGEQMYDMTFEVLYEETGAGLDTICKWVET